MSRFTKVSVSRHQFLLKSIIFWDMTPCSPLSYNQRFGGTYRLHHQGRRNRFSKPVSKQVASRSRMILLATCLLNLFLWPWRWRRYVPPERRLKLNGLHSIISQKIILFIAIAVKTSNPTSFYFFLCTIQIQLLTQFLFWYSQNNNTKEWNSETWTRSE
jgi:hypothetical protein